MDKSKNGIAEELSYIQASNSLVGEWENEYGSILKIEQHNADGSFTGVYTSDTGASGTYPMVGRSPLVGQDNQPVSLSVFWEPLNGTQPDPSWFWVSAMSGVLLLDEGEAAWPTIELLHGMVASTPYDAVQVFEPGIYTETLVFKSLAKTLKPAEVRTSINRFSTPVKTETYILTNQTSSVVITSIVFTYGANGAVMGYFIKSYEEDKKIPIAGFVDPYPEGNDRLFQSISLTGSYKDYSGRLITFTFAGLFNVTMNSVMLQLFESNAVDAANKYAATAVSSQQFLIQIQR